MSASSREAELAASLARVRERIARACASVGREGDEVTLVAVTKTWPASDVRLLAGLGVTDIGENKEQEAHPKHDACADLPLRWHFIGQLQRNKAAAVSRWADCIESVDRPSLVEALARAIRARDPQQSPIDALVQVDLREWPASGDAHTRGGARPEDVPRLADLVASTQGLAMRGLMAVAPQGEDPATAFARLADLAGRVRAEHPEARVLSAGMSSDLEAAVAAGATHVRVGSALLGKRVPLR